MELVKELLVTGVVAVLFSFLIAKLVSLAASGGDSSSKNANREVITAAEIVGEEGKVITEELRFRERLQVEGVKTETKTEFVEQATEKIDEFITESFALENVNEAANREEMLLEIEARDLAQELIEAILREEEYKLKGGEFDNEEVKHVSLASSINENREDESVGIEVDVVETDSKEKMNEIEVNDDEDDDWEGIERSELETMFGEAARFVVESGDKDERFAGVGSDVQMELYGLHKVATEGPCLQKPPMALKVSARAKWNAWQRLGNTSPEAAMEQYIVLVSDRAPGWMEDKAGGDNKPGSSEVTNPVAVTPDLSTFSSRQPDCAGAMTCKNQEPKLVAEERDLTGASNWITGPKNDKHCSAA
ncbi:PREDICTED: acyl-CoA-binding domain-containing protein 3-like [Populus euphratica]|uniref:Acyl-CoA-binding domain-containing protein 3-like n=1 Tax=Populus euphratica TaxID=75702 RepID=A0AAJ6TUA2_POPEU|nr:PREDICTED: acyl-CoA-binding domain-containing protein 3-like [Populus euphratica]